VRDEYALRGSAKQRESYSIGKGGVMLRMLVATLVIATAPLCYKGCGDDDCAPQGGSASDWEPPVFEIEVDQQENMNPFGAWGENYVKSYFGDCVILKFTWDSTELPESMLVINLLSSFWRSNYIPDTTGLKPKYPYYLCGIQRIRLLDGTPVDTLAGASRPIATYSPKPYDTWSYVCVDAPGMSYPMISMACAHELGHQIAALPHLCKQTTSGWDWDTRHHNSSLCLMVKGRYSECTTGDPLTFIHFCDTCKKYTKLVKR
jgi:hypothetical protein